MITDYHAKYYAHELTKRCAAGSMEKFAGTLVDAQVDLNPHQVEAALFAFKSPLSSGAILADEVGLGKTIEAGLVLSQKWAEGKRRIMLIMPSSLRKQWVQELQDKFFLPSIILEAKSYNAAIKAGRQPFEPEGQIIICSYQFAARHAEEIMITRWDLVVIDEAHRLRNVYKSGNKIARALRTALVNVPKVLLTATPLQNSLMELYGLVSFIDEYAFGDEKSFRAKYARLTSDTQFAELKARLKPLCHRTLRRQVLEYVKFTNRQAVTQEFWPSQDEQDLYDMVSDYLQRPVLNALPSAQRRKELKQLFPGVFTETIGEDGQPVEAIDFERLKAELGSFSDVYVGRRERYGMEWPGKRDCMKLIQEPSRATLKPCREESVDFDNTQNLFIEGDNLEVLKLLQKAYYGKVKMIYIDPPYNTGKEFIYPDNYAESLETYLAYAGLVDDEGKKFSTNTATEGRFHTKWLNMMYPRLYLARNLLREDGVIFISIDDNEIENLRRICDEIYGEENFRACISWQKKYSVSNNFKGIASIRDFILIYSRSEKFENGLFPRSKESISRYINPDNDPRGPWKPVDYWNVASVEKGQTWFTQ